MSLRRHVLAGSDEEDAQVGKVTRRMSTVWEDFYGLSIYDMADDCVVPDRCKASRVKCDESKPQCKICLANGVECPGYAKQLRWSSKHEIFTGPKQPETALPVQNKSLAPIEQVLNPITTTATAVNTPPRAASASAGPSSSPSETATPGQTDQGNNSAVAAALSWPNFEELCGYEDFGFSAPLLEPTFGVDSDLGFGELFAANLATASATVGPVYAGIQSHDDNSPRNEDRSEQQAVVSPKTGPAKSSSALLQTFYRMSMPSDVPGFSDQDLIHHYFNSVCAIYSCFDSDLNPFRSTVGRLWQSDKTIYIALQSMAMAHLANWYPWLNPLSLTKRSQAWMSLQNDLRLLRTGKRTTDTVMLSLLLLGPSSPWHQATNLGLQYLLIARNLLQSTLQLNKEELDDFYINAMMHWEMCVSFVDPVPSLPLSGLKEPNFDLLASPNTTAHSWTGIANEICFLLAEVGRVLRRQRGSPSAFEQFFHIEREWFSSLERSFHAIDLPSIDAVVDHGDSRTPKEDLIRCANALRYVGLLEIYCLFPEILETRTTASESLGVLAPLDPPTADSWTLAIALHALELVKPISISSAACRLFPLILLSAASQLRLGSEDREKVVVDARYSVEARMLLLSRKYPQRPFLQMMDVVKEVWDRLDHGAESQGAHWMNIMHEGGMLTLIC